MSQLSNVASSLANSLSEYATEDIVQGIWLLLSLRHEVRPHLQGIVQEEPPDRYVGVITSFFPEKNHGFIHSDAAFPLFGGKDVFLSDKEVGDFQQGNTVSFTIVMNKTGHPQARLLKPAEWQSPAGPQFPPPKFALPRTTGLQQQGRAAMQQQQQQQAIMQPQGHQNLPQHLQQSFAQGMQLAMHQQQTLQPVFAQAIQPGLQAAQSTSFSQFGGQMTVTSPGMMKPPDPNQTQYYGVIRTFDAEKRFGFIVSEQVQADLGTSKDTFLSNKEIGHFGVGDAIVFNVELNKNGQPQARNLQAAQQQEQQQQQQMMQPSLGLVESAFAALSQQGCGDPAPKRTRFDTGVGGGPFVGSLGGNLA